MSEKSDEAPKRSDVVFVHSPTESGDGLRVLRAREDRIEVGELRPLAEGRAIHGEVVRLSPREGEPRLFDAQTLVEAPEARGADKGDRQGPPQFATDAYRRGWEAIFDGNSAPAPKRDAN